MKFNHWIDILVPGVIAFTVSGMVGMILSFLFLWVLFRFNSFGFIIFAGCVALFIKIMEYFKEHKIPYYDEYLKTPEEPYLAEIEEIEHQFQQIFRANWKYISYIPEDYRYPLAIEYLLKYLEQHRAKDLGEAMNLFDEQSHRWTMEDAQSKILRNQQDIKGTLFLIDLDLLLNRR